MLAAIGDAKTCPHGHPIVEGAREEGALLADVEPGAKVRILRFENEAEELLHYLKESGLNPGLEGELKSSDDSEVIVTSGDGEHSVSRSVAETVSVRADPAPAPRAPLPEQLVSQLRQVRPLAAAESAERPGDPLDRPRPSGRRARWRTRGGARWSRPRS